LALSESIMGSGASHEAKGQAGQEAKKGPQVFLQLPDRPRVLLRLEEGAAAGNLYVEHLLGMAAKADDTPVVEALMGLGKLAIEWRDEVTGQSLLHMAASRDNRYLMKQLMQRGADWKARDAEKRTPLHAAASAGAFSAAHLLTKQIRSGKAAVKSYVDELDANGRGALRAAVEAAVEEEKCNDFLANDDPSSSSARSWKRAGSADAAKGPEGVASMLLRLGADVNVRSGANKTTALHEAAREGSLQMCKILLENEADVNARTEESGETPLMLASLSAAAQVIKLLVQEGADATMAANDGSTALSALASASDDVASAGTLIAHGASVGEGFPLHAAVRGGQ